MKNPLRIQLLVLGLTWLALKIWFNKCKAPTLLTSYADDLLVLPLLMGTALLLQRQFVNPAHVYPKLSILAVWLYFTLFFEWVIPRFNTAYTADWRDAVAYFAGAACFGLFMNRPLKRSAGNDRF